MKEQLKTALRSLVLMSIITGLIYPCLVTAVTALIFKNKAQGSLIERNGEIIGSELIGQNNENEKYFWPRPSFNNYNPLPSGASNLGISNQVLLNEIIHRENDFIKANNLIKGVIIPPEMVTASASGLDPHISPEAAFLQLNRVARARNLDDSGKVHILKIITDLTENRQFSMFGEPRINVFLLNLSIDSLNEY